MSRGRGERLRMTDTGILQITMPRSVIEAQSGVADQVIEQ